MPRILLSLSALTVVFLVALLQGCSALNPKELNRDRARQLIEADKNFNQPYVIRLEGSEKFLVPAESADEEPPDARAVQLFYNDYPLTAALHQLGLVEAQATAQKRPEVLAFTGRLTSWEYKIQSRLMAKGTEWAGGRTDGLPLYKREVTEVTGVTTGQSGRAQAEFKWKRVPTPLGEALDPEGATFQSLPAQVQNGIKRSISRFGNALPTSYKKLNNGQAEFQLYDDGWRLEHVKL
ncbi:MAG TPA: hypothetical protein VGW12_07710 [Pyrinomonadaceae bacterium]|nr:hypothetical protein [Pyrinomonadaceae bacterium]